MTRRFLMTLALIGGFAGVGAALAQTVEGLDLDAIRARAAAQSEDAAVLSAEVARRVRDGRANHDYVAARLDRSPWMRVPAKLPPEDRAPDSIQFNLVGMSDEETRVFGQAAAERGVKVQVFGLSTDNARAFWNWPRTSRITGVWPILRPA